MQGGAPGSPGKLVFPTALVSSALGRSGARSAAARGRSPSACAIARLYREGIHVVRYDIENLIKLSQRFGETTKSDIGKRVLGE